jgi:hypothetical protein
MSGFNSSLEPLFFVGNSPAEFKAYYQSELVRWGRVIRERGIKQEK